MKKQRSKETMAAMIKPNSKQKPGVCCKASPVVKSEEEENKNYHHYDKKVI